LSDNIFLIEKTIYEIPVFNIKSEKMNVAEQGDILILEYLLQKTLVNLIYLKLNIKVEKNLSKIV